MGDAFAVTSAITRYKKNGGEYNCLLLLWFLGMIHLVSSLYDSWFGERGCNVLCVGPDGAGKSTLMEHVKLMWQPSNTKREPNAEVLARRVVRPTVGLNMTRVVSREDGLHVALWDLGGQSNLRPLWANYYTQCHAVIFVIDATTVAQRREELLMLLRHILSRPDLLSAPLAIVFNKIDVFMAANGSGGKTCHSEDETAAVLANLVADVALPEVLLQCRHVLLDQRRSDSHHDTSSEAATSCGFGRKVFKCFAVSARTGAGIADMVHWILRQSKLSHRAVDGDDDGAK